MGPGGTSGGGEFLRGAGYASVTETTLFSYVRRSVTDLRDLDEIMDLIRRFGIQQYRQGARDTINALKESLLEHPEDDRNPID